MTVRTPDYQPGDRVPGTVYKVHCVIGAGGMGTVYDVEDTSVGRRYVLKTLHGDLAGREDLAARLSREARALAKLQHPNIVEVFTSGTTQDHKRLPYYVMERLQGQSLRTVLDRKGKLTLEQALDIEIDLLDALDHAHEFGIVHRDVKPDNIFITRGRDGRSLAKLLDFGIIKLAQGSTIVTGARFIGTFRYAPPEQILGRDVTPRSDLYAAALVLYEMIAGRGPFDDFTGEVEIGKAHIDVKAPPLTRWATVPGDLDALVSAALSKKADERPKDAYSFAQTLRAMKQRLAATIANVQASATVDEVISIAPRSARQPERSLRSVETQAGPAFALAPTTASPGGTAVTAGPPTPMLAGGGPTVAQRTATGTMMMSRGDEGHTPGAARAVDRGAATMAERSPAAKAEPAAAGTQPFPLSRPAEPAPAPSLLSPREATTISRSGRASTGLKFAVAVLVLALAATSAVLLSRRARGPAVPGHAAEVTATAIPGASPRAEAPAAAPAASVDAAKSTARKPSSGL